MRITFTIRHSEAIFWLKNEIIPFLQKENIDNYIISCSWLYGPHSKLTIETDQKSKIKSALLSKINSFLQETPDAFEMHYNSQGFRFFPKNTVSVSTKEESNDENSLMVINSHQQEKSNIQLHLFDQYFIFIQTLYSKNILAEEDSFTSSLKLNCLLLKLASDNGLDPLIISDTSYHSFLLDYKKFNYHVGNKSIKEIEELKNKSYTPLFQQQEDTIKNFTEFIFTSEIDDLLDDTLINICTPVFETIFKSIKDHFTAKEMHDMLTNFIRINNHIANNVDDQEGLLLYFLKHAIASVCVQ